MEKAYDRLELQLKKGMKEVYRAQAAAHGMSLNAYIISLLEADAEKKSDWTCTFKTYAPQGITATEYPTGTSFLISI